MAVEITIEVSDTLSRELLQVRDRLPEVLERGLRELRADEASEALQDERTVIEVLASQPTPDQVLALRPSPELLARSAELLARGKQGSLTPQESAELDRYLLLEHLVRLAKAHAFRRLAQES